MQAIYSTLIKELHRFAKNMQFQRTVIGVSGGLDSAVSLCIAVRAFGPKNVTGLVLPEIGLTPEDDINHAKALLAHFGCPLHYQPINNFLVDYNFVTWDKNEISNQNLKARIRASLLHHFTESQNAMLLGTANKSDLHLGLGTIDGELTGHVHPLGDLYKSEVAQLAQMIGLPEELLDKTPSRKLKPYQTDEDDLGAPWSKVDDILQQLAENVDPEALIEKGIDSLSVHKISRMLQQHKEKAAHAPIIQIGRLTESFKKAREAEASSLN